MYTTSKSRVTGLSGIDTESMIVKLMEAESMRMNALTKSKQKLVWKQESYRSVASSLKTFQNNVLSLTTNTSNSIRLTSNFKGLKSSIKVSGSTDESTAISVKTTAGTKAGSHTLEVLSVAKADKYESTSEVASKIDLSNMDYSKIKEGDTINVSLDGGTAKSIKFEGVSGFTSNQDAIDYLNSKLSTAFGSDSGVQKIQAKLGTDGKYAIQTTPGHSVTLTDGARTTTSKTGNDIDFASLGARTELSFDITVAGGETKTIQIGFDTPKNDDGTVNESGVKSMMKQGLDAALKAEGVYGDVSVAFDGNKLKFTSLNKEKSIAIGGGNLSEFGFDADVTLDEASTLSSFGVKTGAKNALDINKTMADVFGSAAFSGGSAAVTINGKNISFNDTDSVSAVMKRINENSDARVSFSSATGKFAIEGKSAGALNAISFSDTTGTVLKDIFKLDSSDATSHTATAADARIIYDGLETTRESNSFEMGDVSITLTTASVDKKFDIKMDANEQGALDVVKNFVKEYNALLDLMNGEYKKSRPTSDGTSTYEPLLDSEKEEMTETQLKEWDAKAKTGLNYNDSTIASISSKLREMVYTPVTLSDGTKLSLYEIGITTSSNFSENGKLVLDDKKFSEAYATKSIEIGEMFTKSSDISYSDKSQRNQRLVDSGIGDRFNDIVNGAILSGGSLYEKAGIEGTSSDLNNDMYKSIKAQEDKIADMKTALIKKENYYYEMFSKMEAAITESNNQMSSLLSMLGQ